MKAKKFISLFLSLILVLQALCVNVNIKNVKAADSDITNVLTNFITGVNVTDKDGNLITTSINKSDSIRITYSWQIKDGDTIEEGDFYIINLPNEIKIKENARVDIKDQYGKKIADLYVSTDKTLKVVFTDYVKNNEDITGEIFFECGFDEKEIVGDGEKNIEFKFSGGSEDITIEFKKPTIVPGVEKSGVYDNSDGTITWTIVVNKEKGTIKEGAKITDEIQSNSSATQVYVDNSAKISCNGNISGLGFSYNNGELTYEFNSNSEDTHTITFKTKVEVTNVSVYNAWINNTVKFVNDGNTKTAKASINIIIGDINKTGRYDSENSKILWTITINENNKSINNATVSDKIPNNLEFEEGSVEIWDGSKWVKAPDRNGGTGYKYDSTSRTLEYYFGTITTKQQIRFKTKVTISNITNTGSEIFTNTAYLNGNGSTIGTEGKVDINNSIIEKIYKSHNIQNGEIEWSVYINRNRAKLDDTFFKDTIEDNQEYVEDSFSVKNVDDGTWDWTTDKAKLEYDNVSKTLTYDFGNINNMYIVNFKTKIIDYNSDIFKNTGVLEFDGREEKSEAIKSIPQNLIKKTPGQYDYLNKEMTWKIDVNASNLPLTNVVVEDVIPSGQEYIDGSFKISPNVKGTLEYNSRTLKYTFEEPINSKYTIEFKTKIEDSIFDNDGKATVTNKATLTADEIPNGISSEAEKEIINEEIKKGFNYTKGEDVIDWFVIGNISNLPVQNATIEDTLQDGLVLETDTIKLHKMILDTSEKYVLGNEIALSPSNVEYDKSTNIFKFNFPGDITGPFKLSFSTKVTKEGTYKNKILFKGNGVEKTSEVQTEKVEYNKLGGWGTIYDGSIKIKKVDSNNPNATLAGAVFRLLDQYNNVMETSPPTGNDGIAEFKNLKYNVEYKVEEVTPPSGYIKSNYIHNFMLKNNKTERNIEYTFKNDKRSVTPPPSSSDDGKIILEKVNENGDSLEGVEFTLYDINGKTIRIEKSDKNGVVEFANLPYGKYIVKETKALSGYKILNNDINVEVNSSLKVYNIGLVKNEKIPVKPPVVPEDDGKIIIEKVDGDDVNKPLSGAIFQLLDENGNILKISAPTGKDGKVEFNNLKYNVKYIVKELTPPSGYNKSDHKEEVVLKDNSNEKVIKITFKNYKIPPIVPEDNGKIIIKKVDGYDTSKPLSGAMFELLDENDKLLDISSTTGQNGITEFTGLKYGVKYKIKEIFAPSGYIRSDEVYEFTLENERVIEYTFKNYKDSDTPTIPERDIPTTPKKEITSVGGKIPSMLPKTGSLFDTQVLVGIGIGITFLGSILLFKGRRKLK